MTGPRPDPWADPRTETETGAPYAGPPVTGPAPAWPPSGYGPPAGYGAPPYGYGGHPQPSPAWGWPGPPPAPRRPGQVIAAAVLAFVQAAMVLIASIYVFMFAALAELAAGTPGFSRSRSEELALEGQILAVVQLVSAVALVVAGIMALTRRTRSTWTTLVAALGLQVALAVYWLVRLTGLVGTGLDDAGALAFASLMLAAGPAVALGLVITGAGRRWFAGDAPA